MTIDETDHAKTVTGRSIAGSWYKKLGKVFITLDIKKNNAPKRDSAKKVAERFSQTHGFPEFKVTQVKRTKGMPNLCLVIGKVIG